MISIVDLSNNNGPVNWAEVATTGIKCAFIKATEGLTFNDGLFQHNRRLANSCKIRVGAYHFAHPANNPVAEANHFIGVVKTLQRSDLKPVLDFEYPVPTDVDAHAWIHNFNKTVKNALGSYPIFYSYPAFIEGLNLGRPVGNGLWIAAYDRNDGTEHPFSIPRPWKRVVAHQFSSRCRVSGCTGLVDLSHAKRLRPLLAHPFVGL